MVKSSHMGVVIGERGLEYLVHLGRDTLVAISRHAYEISQAAHATRCIVSMFLW